MLYLFSISCFIYLPLCSTLDVIEFTFCHVIPIRGV
ncbi:hypothetical protein M6B38_342680 [Iris pallida]|uniref:Uncharacterized protein n=1 Tax=Iris pallida TaxID=29817 RepID=A0AAX6GXF5_IRIPA|nr:hypothetical protein M6B38_342680 [Iris pallida]